MGFTFLLAAGKEDILQQLGNDTCRFNSLSVITKASGKTCVMWSSRDAPVLNALTRLLTPLLPQCEHVSIHGGGKQSVSQIHHHLRNSCSGFVFRTDIKGYYASINQDRLYHQLTRYIHCPVIRFLLWQFLHYTVEGCGSFHAPIKGLPRLAH